MTRVYAYAYMIQESPLSTIYSSGTMEIETDGTKESMLELSNDIAGSIAKSNKIKDKKNIVITFIAQLGEYDE